MTAKTNYKTAYQVDNVNCIEKKHHVKFPVC